MKVVQIGVGPIADAPHGKEWETALCPPNYL